MTDINMDYEVNKLVELLDDGFDSAVEEFDMDFTERQYNDWISEHGLTETSAAEFSSVIDEILRRALEVLIKRWKEKKQVW